MLTYPKEKTTNADPDIFSYCHCTAGVTGRSKTSGLSGAVWLPLFVDLTVFLLFFFFLGAAFSDCTTVSDDTAPAFGLLTAVSVASPALAGSPSELPPGRPTSSITAYTAAKNAMKVSVAILRRRVVFISEINQIVQEV